MHGQTGGLVDDKHQPVAVQQAGEKIEFRHEGGLRGGRLGGKLGTPPR
jgi:hypothetical protein